MMACMLATLDGDAKDGLIIRLAWLGLAGWLERRMNGISPKIGTHLMISSNLAMATTRDKHNGRASGPSGPCQRPTAHTGAQ